MRESWREDFCGNTYGLGREPGASTPLIPLNSELESLTHANNRIPVRLCNRHVAVYGRSSICTDLESEVGLRGPIVDSKNRDDR